MEFVKAWYLHDPKSKTCRRDIRVSEIKMKAKDHLLSLGWDLWYAPKKGRGHELRYTSPRGKCYYSLKNACKACMDDVGGGGNGMRAAKVSSSTLSAMVSVKSRSRKRKQQDVNLDNKDDGLKRKSLKKESSSPNSTKTGQGKDINKLMALRDGDKRNKESKSSNKNVFTLLIENKIIRSNSTVSYYVRPDSYPVLKGRVTRDGIKCKCCKKVFDMSGFQKHASGSTQDFPAASICLDDGRSLLHCQFQLRGFETCPRGRTKSCSQSKCEDVDICSVCNHGGKLVSCASCPSAFHRSCIGLKNVPDGEWFCSSCCCGFCGLQRKAEDDAGVLSCNQCECKYHIRCLRITRRLQNYNPTSNWFCCGGCQSVFLGLQKLVGRPISVGGDGLSWTLLKHSDQLGVEGSTEINNKLELALEVMHECFEPAKNPCTGRDLIEDVVFSKGSDKNGLSFQGFYTFLLENEDEVISVANVRVHGQKVAEIPLVGTRFRHRRSGMCRILMTELERQLAILGVQRLILPAAVSVVDTWINCFGYSKITKSQRVQLLDHSFLDFGDTIMCQKLLVKIPPTPLQPEETHGNCFNYKHNQELSPKSEVCEP